jgi:hypothetical protein
MLGRAEGQVNVEGPGSSVTIFGSLRGPQAAKISVVRKGRRCDHCNLLIQRGRESQKALASKVQVPDQGSSVSTVVELLPRQLLL